MKKYYWTGISNDERKKAIAEITSIINNFASILNFQRFSDISLGLILEIEEHKINDLEDSLKNIMFIEGTDIHLTDSKTDCIVF
jgi:hypothetical protein